MKLLTCKQASFSYENNSVVTNINFEVKQGDYLCIVGRNGSGKSTLINGLLNLKQPSRGKIVFTSNLKREDIGYLPQQKNVQHDFPASVFEVVLSGRLNNRGIRPFYTKKDKDIANKNILKLGLYDLKQKPYSELSGGQRQRVLLARALCSTTKLLVLDEPVSALDPLVTSDFYNLINNLNKKENITIVMVSHDINAAIKYSSHILHLDNNQLFFGLTSDYLKSNIGKKYLGGINDA